MNNIDYDATSSIDNYILLQGWYYCVITKIIAFTIYFMHEYIRIKYRLFPEIIKITAWLTS